ncbi:MAG: hypothetical protein D3904_14600, partial [Candidatus Electrothrix sp. EH2]|nr:hypothetical protein [Candidatus Electrothrix sp. EH2]
MILKQYQISFSKKLHLDTKESVSLTQKENYILYIKKMRKVKLRKKTTYHIARNPVDFRTWSIL